jgi:hypothetical protein
MAQAMAIVDLDAAEHATVMLSGDKPVGSWGKPTPRKGMS